MGQATSSPRPRSAAWSAQKPIGGAYRHHRADSLLPSVSPVGPGAAVTRDQDRDSSSTKRPSSLSPRRRMARVGPAYAVLLRTQSQSVWWRTRCGTDEPLRLGTSRGLVAARPRQPDAVGDIRPREGPPPLGIGEFRAAGRHDRTGMAVLYQDSSARQSALTAVSRTTANNHWSQPLLKTRRSWTVPGQLGALDEFWHTTPRGRIGSPAYRRP